MIMQHSFLQFQKRKRLESNLYYAVEQEPKWVQGFLVSFS